MLTQTAILAPVSDQLPDQVRDGARKKRTIAWWESLSPCTRRGYMFSVRSFFKYLEEHEGIACDVEEVIQSFFAGRFDDKLEGLRDILHAYVETWKNKLVAQAMKGEISTGTINLHIGALRAIVRKGLRRSWIVSWILDIEGIKHEPYKNTIGPPIDDVQKLLDTAVSQKRKIKALRDVALIRVLFDCGLRRAECIGLKMKHLRIDSEDGTIIILGKGKKAPEPTSIPPETAQALREYVAALPTPAADDSVFVSISNAGELGETITGEGVRRLLKFLSKKAGIGTVRPHGLRHASITHLLNVNGGNLREAVAHSRHASANTLRFYDDNRKEEARTARGKIAASLITRRSNG